MTGVNGSFKGRRGTSGSFRTHVGMRENGNIGTGKSMTNERTNIRIGANRSAQASDRRGSVGFDGSRYTRRSTRASDIGIGNAVFARAERKAYIAPDAEVMLMPGAIERVAIEELFADDDLRHGKHKRVSIREKIKNATHRESEAYTMYGVETDEIFTEEFEIDVPSGVAFSAARDGEATSRREGAYAVGSKDGTDSENGNLSSNRSHRSRDGYHARMSLWSANTYKKMMCSLRDIAYKINHFRIGGKRVK